MERDPEFIYVYVHTMNYINTLF